MTLLSKSKYLIGLQCLKYFWIDLHEKDRIPEHDLSTQHRFDQGHIVGQLAKKMFPEGIDIPESDFKGGLNQTKELIKLGKPLFEPAFMVGNLYSRADILEPNGDGWDIIEVKSGTKVKDINVEDVAFQRYVYGLAGLKIRKCFLMHVNNQFVKDGEVDPEKFFTKEDITSQVDEITNIKERVAEMIEVMKSDVCPTVKISKDCADPYGCPLEDECWGFLPSSSVFDLHNIRKKKAFQWLDDGMQLLTDVPSDLLNNKQGIQRACEKNGTVHVNKQELKKFLGGLKEPIYYLDFETFMSAVPLLEGTRPYQQIPFQWSLHVNDKHYEFLAPVGDPREEFLKTLKEVLGSSGTIVVYNQSFEITRLRELALVFPKYKDWVESVVSRVVDLIVPFKTFSYYNPKQKGKCGLKNVLPAILGKDPYADLNINDGGLALISYLSMTYGDGPDVRDDLLKYCCLDTEGMVWIVEKLRELV